MAIKIFGYIDSAINHLIGLVTGLPWYYQIPATLVTIIVAVWVTLKFATNK